MLFWLLYFFISFLIGFLSSLFFQRKFLKIFTFFLVFFAMTSIWFKTPGENEMAPILSILLLESSILDSNGLMRLIRPFSLSILCSITFSFILWRRGN